MSTVKISSIKNSNLKALAKKCDSLGNNNKTLDKKNEKSLFLRHAKEFVTSKQCTQAEFDKISKELNEVGFFESIYNWFVDLFTDEEELSLDSLSESTLENIGNVVNTYNQDKKDEARILNVAKRQGYKPNYKVSNSVVSNQYYKGSAYSVEFSGLNVTVKNKKTGKQTTANLYKYLKQMPDNDKIKFLRYIQTLPGEVIEDLLIEMEDIDSPQGRDMHTRDNPEFISAGYYTSSTDSIVTNPQSLVHELGHALDFQGVKNNSTVLNNKKFLQSFDNELKEYIRKGNVQYDYDDSRTWRSYVGTSNYCTANPKELFAEAYALAMTGNCNSKMTILRHFPKTFEIAKELIAEIRGQSPMQRRFTTSRMQSEQFSQIFNNMTNIK